MAAPAARRVDALDATNQRQERVRARAREDILRAAAKTFAREGLDASMQSIAREAGYAAPSLYSYFARKEDIALALASSLRSAFLATFIAGALGMDAGYTNVPSCGRGRM